MRLRCCEGGAGGQWMTSGTSSTGRSLTRWKPTSPSMNAGLTLRPCVQVRSRKKRSAASPWASCPKKTCSAEPASRPVSSPRAHSLSPRRSVRLTPLAKRARGAPALTSM